MPPGVQVEKRTLRYASATVVNRCIFLAPIDRETEPPKQVLVSNFVLLRDHVTQFDKVGTRNHQRLIVIQTQLLTARFDIQVFDVWQRGIGSHIEVVLDSAFGR